jgi:hypothetical protein
LFRGPSQERFVVDARQSGILRANDVDPGIHTEQRTKDIVIEVLVGELAQHYTRRRASNRSRIPAGGHLDSFASLVSRLSRRRCAR